MKPRMRCIGCLGYHCRTLEEVFGGLGCGGNNSGRVVRDSGRERRRRRARCVESSMDRFYGRGSQSVEDGKEPFGRHGEALFAACLCRSRRACVVSAHAVVMPPPPPLSAGGASLPCVVWSLRHCLVCRGTTWRRASMLPQPCVTSILVCMLSCPSLYITETNLKPTCHMVVVKVVRPLLSFLQPLAGWPACGSSIPAHTPQVWNAAPSAP